MNLASKHAQMYEDLEPSQFLTINSEFELNIGCFDWRF